MHRKRGVFFHGFLTKREPFRICNMLIKHLKAYLAYYRYDLYGEKLDDPSLMGMSPLGGACTADRVSVTEDRSFIDTVFTFAHELAHK